MKIQYKIALEVEVDDNAADLPGTLRKTVSDNLEKTLNTINSETMELWYVKSVDSKLHIYDENNDTFLVKQLKYSKEK